MKSKAAYKLLPPEKSLPWDISKILLYRFKGIYLENVWNKSREKLIRKLMDSGSVCYAGSWNKCGKWRKIRGTKSQSPSLKTLGASISAFRPKKYRSNPSSANFPRTLARSVRHTHHILTLLEHGISPGPLRSRNVNQIAPSVPHFTSFQGTNGEER